MGSRHALACAGVMRGKTLYLLFQERPRVRMFGSSFHLIMNEDFLRNAGTPTRSRKSLDTKAFSISLFSLALIHGSQVLLCPKFVKKVCCDHDDLSLNNNKARFRSTEIERHSGETARPYLCLLNHASSCGMVARTFALLLG